MEKKPSKIIPEKCVGYVVPSSETVVTANNAILYALGKNN